LFGQVAKDFVGRRDRTFGLALHDRYSQWVHLPRAAPLLNVPQRITPPADVFD
jgi:hypothetical protein